MHHSYPQDNIDGVPHKGEETERLAIGHVRKQVVMEGDKLKAKF